MQNNKTSSNIKTYKIVLQKIHGLEPSSEISTNMKQSHLILALTKMSMAHTNARMQASISGARYLSLAEYSLKILKDKSIKELIKAILSR